MLCPLRPLPLPLTGFLRDGGPGLRVQPLAPWVPFARELPALLPLAPPLSENAFAAARAARQKPNPAQTLTLKLTSLTSCSI